MLKTKVKLLILIILFFSSSLKVFSQPIISSLQIVEVGNTSVSLQCEVLNENGNFVTNRGFVWDDTMNPIIETGMGFSDSGEDIGLFCDTITGFNDGQIYYIRAYAINDDGITYSDTEQFSTLELNNCGVITDLRDGNTYETVEIGAQCWMAENLRYLPTVTGDFADWYSESSNYAVYDYISNDNLVSQAILEDEYRNYGVLYNSYAANAACPEGWRLPTETDLNVLENYIINTSEFDHAYLLKSCRQESSPLGEMCETEQHPRWDESDYYGIDNYGFNALPGGLRHLTGSFLDMGSTGYWWGSNINKDNQSVRFSMSIDNNNLNISYREREMGYSIRCIQETSLGAIAPEIITVEPFDITPMSFVTGGEIVNDGSCSIVEKGIVYGNFTGINLELNDGKILCGMSSENYTTKLLGFNADSTYYIRAYAINLVDTAYGDEIEILMPNFDDCGLLTDIRDGNIYKTVQIGNQCWLAENLKYLPEVTGPNEEWVSEDPKYAVYAYLDALNSVADAKLEENYLNYGALYNWPAAQDACPEGWHLPTNTELEQLFVSVEEYSIEYFEEYFLGLGNAMKSCNKSLEGCYCSTTNHPYWSVSNSAVSRNFVGFNAFPGGHRTDDFSGLIYSGRFWVDDYDYINHTSTPLLFTLSHTSNDYYLNDVNITETYSPGYSIRCIKDADLSASIPSLVLNQVGPTTENAVDLSAEITDIGGDNIVLRGFVISSTPSPELESCESYKLIEDQLLEYAATLQGFSPNSTYYIRAFAENNVGIGYSNEIEINTLAFSDCGELVDSRDGKTYKTSLIGEQCWMSENLKYLPSINGPNSDWSTNEPAYTVYDYTDEANSILDAEATEYYNAYGVLYNWASAPNACPDGWHLPTINEWDVLISYLEQTYDLINESNSACQGVAHTLVSCRSLNSLIDCYCQVVEHPYWNYGVSDDCRSDWFGFSVLPSGTRSYNGTYSNMGSSTGFWIVGDTTDYNASIIFFGSSDNINLYHQNKRNGSPIRCIKDYSPLADVPQVSTNDIISTEATMIKVSCEVVSSGGVPVVERGLIYNTTPTLDIDNNLGYLASGVGPGVYEVSINGLDKNTEYYFRAYAINSSGIAYGDVISASTIEYDNCGVLFDDRNGKVYETVIIGSQCWMAENLKYLPEVTGNDAEWYSTDPRYAVYDYDDIANSTIYALSNPNYGDYGVLYNWYAAIDACPEGWHLPDTLEWSFMFKEIQDNFGIENINDEYGMGNSLKSCRQGATPLQCECEVNDQPRWEYYNDEGYGTNLFGFSALPGGIRHYLSGNFGDNGYVSYMWSATPLDEIDAFCYYMHSGLGDIRRYEREKEYGFSIRCVKDLSEDTEEPEIITYTPTDVTLTSALIGGEIVTSDDVVVFQKGVLVGIGPNVTYQNNLRTYLSDDNSLDFEFYCDKLMVGTNYYCKAFAITSFGLQYGQAHLLTTVSVENCGIITDERDLNSYKTVKIGNQCWMAENLKYLPSVDSLSSYLEMTSPQYFVSSYSGEENDVWEAINTEGYAAYGVLYNWYAATGGGSAPNNQIGVQGICPSGWHLPSEQEWIVFEMNMGIPDEEIFDFYRGDNEGCKLAGNYSKWNIDSLVLDDEFGVSGFNALPGGAKYNTGISSVGAYGNFWVSADTSVNDFIYRRLAYSSPRIWRGELSSGNAAFSVRCMKNLNSEIVVPEVITGDVISICPDSVILSGNVLFDGNELLANKGIIIGLNPFLTVEDNVEIISDPSIDFEIFSTFYGLMQGTTYYFRAYAINSVGTAYGEVRSFDADYCGEVDLNIVYSEPQLSSENNLDVCWDYENDQPNEMQIQLSGTYPPAAYPLDDESIYYTWDFGDGSPIEEGIGLNEVSHIYPESGGYNLLVTITDSQGCENANIINQIVRVSFPIDWVSESTYLSNNTILQGEFVEMCVAFNDTIWTPEISYQLFENTDTTLIIDCDGNVYETSSSIFIDLFNDGDIINSENSLNSVNLNLVHSFLGDLAMFLECPNGQRMQLVEQDGGGINLGEPPDVGFWYTFAPNADMTLHDYVNTLSVGTVSAGEFLPYESFENLVGCPINGEWKILIYDQWSADTGYLNSWQLYFTDEVFTMSNYSTNYQVIDWEGGYGSYMVGPTDSLCVSGTYFTTSTPDVTSEEIFTCFVIDELGCMFDTSLNITVLGLSNGNLPEVEINSVTNFTQGSALFTGTVLDEGDYPVMSKGFVWSLYEDPVVADCDGLTNEGAGSGEFSSVVSNLESGQTYFVRSYATNEAGITYSSSMSLDFINEEEYLNFDIDSFDLYPNPAKKTVRVINVTNKNILKIYDVVGKLVMTISINGDTDIDISELENGTYIFVVYSEKNGVRLKKLIKQ